MGFFKPHARYRYGINAGLKFGTLLTQLVKIKDLDLAAKRVLLREDYNVPLNGDIIEDDNRIKASLPTIKTLLEIGAKIIIISHLGRPQEGQYDAALSLAPVAKKLSQLLAMSVPLIKNWTDGIDMTNRDIVICENVRFQKGELENEDILARKMAALCDVYINDAFATAHRMQASTHSVVKYVPVAAAGPLLISELKYLSKIYKEQTVPMVAILGGSKVGSKLNILSTFVEKMDKLIVGGGIANTFLKASGANIGRSIYEQDMLEESKKIIQLAADKGVELPLPVDAVCAKDFSAHADISIKRVNKIESDDMILDIGPETIAKLTKLLKDAATIIWNGPIGVFEFDRFSAGTHAIAQSIANNHAFSIVGGGDTLSALKKFGLTDKMSYISTGGGAFLEFLEGKTLPAVAILDESARAWAAMERAREY